MNPIKAFLSTVGYNLSPEPELNASDMQAVNSLADTFGIPRAEVEYALPDLHRCSLLAERFRVAFGTLGINSSYPSYAAPVPEADPLADEEKRKAEAAAELALATGSIPEDTEPNEGDLQEKEVEPDPETETEVEVSVEEAEPEPEVEETDPESEEETGAVDQEEVEPEAEADEEAEPEVEPEAEADEEGEEQ